MDVGQDLGTVQRVLDLMQVRARVAVHNLANQNTPGFKAYGFDFEEALRRATESQGPDAQESVPVRIEQDRSGAPTENTVDAFVELNALTKVRLLQDVYSRRAAGHFDRMRQAIRGGR